MIGTADEVTGQAAHAFVTLKPEFSSKLKEAVLAKELVGKVVEPCAAPNRRGFGLYWTGFVGDPGGEDHAPDQPQDHRDRG